jgi:uncharacterized protein
MAELVLHVQDIDETGKDYSFELTPAWLDASLRDATLRADPAYESGRIDLHAQQNGTEYLVNGTIGVHLLTECGRCLGDAAVDVDVPFATLFHRSSGKPGAPRKPRHERVAIGGRAPADAEELGEDDMLREEFAGHDIVLDDLVREHIVLEVPMQPLCSEACQGIAVPEHLRPPEEVFGTKDDGVDPRLAPLKRLRDKVPPNKE